MTPDEITAAKVNQEEAVSRIQLLRSYARNEQPFDFQDPKLLAQLAYALLERCPDDLSMGGWESPTAPDRAEELDEVMDLAGLIARAGEIHGCAPGTTA